jgi:hypothetical protein
MKVVRALERAGFTVVRISGRSLSRSTWAATSQRAGTLWNILAINGMDAEEFRQLRLA